MDVSDAVMPVDPDHRASKTPEPLVVYAGDERVALGIAVSIASLLNHEPSAHVLVLADSWSLSGRQRLEELVGGPGLAVREIDASGFPEVTDHITKAAYARLTIAKLLPHQGLALYLDSDTLVRRPILRDLARRAANMRASTAAVRDSETPFIGSSSGLSSWREDSLDPRAPYVNSGVLLMNLAAWRRDSIGERALDWKRTHPLAWMDQDALNAVLNGEVELLPHRFNSTMHMMRRESPVYGIEVAEEVDEARRDPAVVHFTGAIKPWHSNASMPFLDEWRDLAARIGRTSFPHSFSRRRRLERWLIRKIDSRA